MSTHSPIVGRPGILAAALAVLTLLVGALLWWGLEQIRPLPPHQIVMTTGPDGSEYHELGRRYRDLLATHGITVELRPSAGDVENLDRLDDSTSGAEVGFVQGGLTDASRSPALASLGTVLTQPLWIFYRGAIGTPTGFLAQLDRERVSAGEVGSGTRALTLQLLAETGIDTIGSPFADLAPEAAAAGLMRGDLDAVVILSGWDAPAVQQLLRAPGINVLPLRRAEALAVLNPFLDTVTLPEGAGDLALNNPPADVSLLADRSSLLIRHDLHPAIQHLLLDAAEQIHARPELWSGSGQFPAPEAVDVPLSSVARHFYKSGRPFLQRHLPFWMAAVAERFVVLLLPLLGIMIPLARAAPALIELVIRHRILGLYTELRGIEKELAAHTGDGAPDDLVERLDRLDRRAHSMALPISYTPMLYTLRHHITLVQERIAKR